MSSQQEYNIEDLISKNAETYHIAAQAAKFHPSHRHSVNLFEKTSADFMSGNSNKCALGRGLSVSPKLQEGEPTGSVDQAKSNSKHSEEASCGKGKLMFISADTFFYSKCTEI
jgi:hypothetical protein